MTSGPPAPLLSAPHHPPCFASPTVTFSPPAPLLSAPHHSPRFRPLLFPTTPLPSTPLSNHTASVRSSFHPPCSLHVPSPASGRPSSPAQRLLAPLHPPSPLALVPLSAVALSTPLALSVVARSTHLRWGLGRRLARSPVGPWRRSRKRLARSPVGPWETTPSTSSQLVKVALHPGLHTTHVHS